jgi:hypothetical protein
MGWVFNALPLLLYPWIRDPVLIVQEDGWASGLVRTGEEDLTLSGILSLVSSAHSELLYRLRYRPTIFHPTSHIGRPTSTELSTEDRM